MARTTILCIDDSEAALRIRKLLLESAGYRVLTAGDGPTALRLFAAECIDLVITDYYLAENLTGATLAAYFKAARPNVPVLWMSGAVEAPPSVEHFDGYIRKTDRFEVMLQEVARKLGRPAAVQVPLFEDEVSAPESPALKKPAAAVNAAMRTAQARRSVLSRVSSLASRNVG